MSFKDPNTTLVIAPIVDNLNSVDEKWRELYAETNDGKYQLRADIGFQADFENTRKALQNEREISKNLRKEVNDFKSKLDAYDGVDATAVKGMKTELENLKSTETDLSVLKSNKAELELKLTQTQEQLTELKKLNERFEKERTTMTLKEKARKALKDQGILDSAMDDGLLWAVNTLETAEDGSVRVKDGSSVPAGISVDSWASLMKKSKPYLFGGSVGGGASGSALGTTPIDNWTNTGLDGGVNITKLMLAIREDPKAVRAVAKAKGIDLSKYAYMMPKDE